MNKSQRVVLIIGAIVLLIVIFNPPVYYYYIERIDVGGAALRALGVIGATLLVTYALKDKKKEQ